jgi:hypothetical protein
MAAMVKKKAAAAAADRIQIVGTFIAPPHDRHLPL